MKWADELQIETPEQIDVNLEIAGLGSRFIAQLIDWVIKWGLFLAILLLGAIVLAMAGVNISSGSIGKGMTALLVAVFYFFLLGWDIYYELRRNGQTPGKRSAGIRVLREDGGPVDFRAACIRNLLNIADMLPGLYLLGGLIVLLNQRGQRLGDMAAGTIVVRERVMEVPGDEGAEIERISSTEFAFTSEQLSSCQSADRHILRSFFQRVKEMNVEARRQLTARLSTQFLKKTGYEPAFLPEDIVRAEAFLASLYRDLESHQRH